MNDEVVTANAPVTTTNTENITTNTENITTNTEGTTPSTKPATRADQDQRIQNFITEVSQEIATTKQNSALLAELLRLGVDEAELTTGEDLTLDAQGSFTLRQQAIGNKDAANARVESAYLVVHARGADFRDVVRLAFTDAPSQRALGVTGRVPLDKQKLITQLRASFATTATAPYAAELTRRSYGPAALAAATAEVNALDTALATRAAVTEQAVAATAARDSDYKALRTWATRFHRAVKRARTRLA